MTTQADFVEGALKVTETTEATLGTVTIPILTKVLLEIRILGNTRIKEL